MNCTKCGERVFPGLNTIERIRHGEPEFRHRICARRRKAPKQTKYQLSKPKKRGWDRARNPALTTKCEVSGHVFATVRARRSVTYVNRVVDHLYPERAAVETGKDPHARINLICIHANVHGKKRAAEDKLLKSGDIMTYLQELAYQGFPLDRVHAALRFYEVRHGAKCPVCMAAGLHVVTQPPTQDTGDSTDGNPPGS